MKAEVALSRHTNDEVAHMLDAWDQFAQGLASHKRLYGGYSGSNYMVTSCSGFKGVLKVCNAYATEEVEAQAQISAHLHTQGFTQACAAIPRADDASRFTTTAPDGTPCLLLSWVEGTAADKVIAAGVAAPTVLRAIGDGLGSLHCVPVLGSMRTFKTGGACDVRCEA